jgi:hypothetical protein
MSSTNGLKNNSRTEVPCCWNVFVHLQVRLFMAKIQIQCVIIKKTKKDQTFTVKLTML